MVPVIVEKVEENPLCAVTSAEQVSVDGGGGRSRPLTFPFIRHRSLLSDEIISMRHFCNELKKKKRF